MRHGGQILVDQLKINGVDRVFSVPGESFLAALDGLYESGIETVVCRQEGGAAMMAEADAKLTGRPGVLFVTRGPGATNAASGLHVAMHDSTPMVVFVGQIDSGHRDRAAFQEVDYRAFFGPLVKWVGEVDRTARLPEYIARAFHVAQSGRPGPVVLALPEDVLSARAEAADRPAVAKAPVPGAAEAVGVIRAALAKAERPLAVVGGPGWSDAAASDLATVAAAMDLPVAAGFRRQDYLDNRLPHYVGDLGVGANPRLAQRLGEADLVLALGSRLGETVTGGYTWRDPAGALPRLIHVHPDPDELGRVYHPDPGIALPVPVLLAEWARQNDLAPGPWADWRSAARADYEAWQDPAPTPGAVRMEEVVRWLSDHLAEDAIVTNGAGNYAAFVHRYFRYKRFGTQLAPTSGSMGYGLPAAVAASLRHPDRTVVCFAGDGCLQMTVQELSTAAQHGATPIVIVANNGKYGTIRMHQERAYPGRVSGTRLVNPDFAALAGAYGGLGLRVTETGGFADAFETAKASGKLALIELVLDDDMLATGASISDLRRAAGLA